MQVAEKMNFCTTEPQGKGTVQWMTHIYNFKAPEEKIGWCGDLTYIVRKRQSYTLPEQDKVILHQAAAAVQEGSRV